MYMYAKERIWQNVTNTVKKHQKESEPKLAFRCHCVHGIMSIQISGHITMTMMSDHHIDYLNLNDTPVINIFLILDSIYQILDRHVKHALFLVLQCTCTTYVYATTFLQTYCYISKHILYLYII